MKQELFGDIDFSAIANDDNFKEASVREFVILPVLNKLGYTTQDIILEKGIQVQSGSKKQRSTIYADYVIKIDDNFVCVIEAKSPQKNINSVDYVEQAFSYSSHDSIRSPYFALCNGIEFALYRTDLQRTKLLQFQIADIENYWDELSEYIARDSFRIKDNIKSVPTAAKRKEEFDYKNRHLLKPIPVRKQAAKRHFGVHGYFTRQAWNVVQKYIKNYTQPGDLVLDPFGGTGVTAIEAMMTERKAISIDLNPLAVFITQSLLASIDFNKFQEAFKKIKNEYIKLEPKTKVEIDAVLKKYKLPKDLPLPKNSDVKSVLKLFTKKQLSQLALLKSIIKKQKDKNIKLSFMLIFSGIVSKANLSTHSNENIAEGKKAQGGFQVGAFQYYRYRIAHHPKQLDILKYFESRFKRIYAAKKDIEYYVNENTTDNVQIIKGTATDLSFIENERVDYIYTDPPYGKKIPYLDLSTMWNAWLDLDVTEKDYELEAIEGGEHNKTKQEYIDLIAKSIKEMYRVLKFDRWLSFVFAHKDPEFWHLIVETAENCGFEYKGTVSQKNGHKSFKKIQNPFTVLSGQLIINFIKTKNPKALIKANLGMTTLELLMQTIEGIIAKNNGATLEQIYDEVIIKGVELGFLHKLKKDYDDLTPLLRDNFDYDTNSQKYFIKKGFRLTAKIDLNIRIKYYLISYLQEKGRENINPNFDDIVLNVMPNLKNGKTPNEQTILSELEKIAIKVGKDGWKLANGELF
ncbi:MAG: type I restriction enzyme HsdR N-terminal domain-containing protein [Bacteroidetes bacterium]|nr:type I restriction enzyme HsdR N-terminal domain-containing protein [Bacteroidota bacterium]